jgi:cell division septum initiation protein DivIVA
MSDSPYSLPRPEFRQKRQGYHPDEVDEWIDNAFATIEAVNREIAELRDRLANASSMVSAVPGSSTTSSPSTGELDETLRRTLVLAQKTADAAIKEAQEEAQKITTDARAEAQRAVDSANDEARRITTDAQQHVRADVLKLEAARTELESDVSKLQAYLNEERERLRSTLSEALTFLDKGAEEGRAAPSLSEIQIPSEPNYGRFASSNAAQELEDDEDVDDFPSAESDFAPAASSEAPPWANEATASITPIAPPTFEDKPAGDTDDDEEDDQYMAELRRAVSDPTPLGPRDDDEEEESGTGEYADLTGPVPVSSEPQTSDFTSEDFYSPEDDEDGDAGLGGRLRRRR